MDSIWNAILQFLAKFVTPDWGSAVGLLPLAVGALVALFLVLVALAFFFAGPTRRGRRRMRPMAPPGVHEGEPSIAPLLVAVGAAVLFFGLVFRGPILVAGLFLTIAALLYWGVEAIRDFDRLVSHESGGRHAAGAALLPLDSLGGPPLPRLAAPAEPAAALTAGSAAPGAGSRAPAETMHAPAPSFRPLLVSVGAAVVFFGLVFGPAILIAGIVMLAIALLGWLFDAGAEYRATVRADRTGHVDPLPAPRYPVVEAVLFVLVLAVALTARFGIFPFEPTPAAAPAAGASASAPVANSTGNAGGGQGPASTLRIAAKGLKFDVQSLEAPGNTQFTIEFTNDDASVPHNVAIHKGSATGEAVFEGEIFAGPGSRTYTVKPLPPGNYAFVCSVHPDMQGTLTVR